MQFLSLIELSGWEGCSPKLLVFAACNYVCIEN